MNNKLDALCEILLMGPGPSCVPPEVYTALSKPTIGHLDPQFISIMDEIGLDISAHNPISLDELADTSFDVVVTLSPEAHHMALELTRTMAVDVEYWPTMDPTITSGNRETMLDAYRTVRDQLMQRIKARFGW